MTKATKKARKILLQVNGGLGANILKTTLVKALRADNPDAIIHVKASYPDVFKNLKECDSYVSGNQVLYGAYDTYKDFEFMGEQEPYLDKDYRDKKCHYVDAACRRHGIDNFKGNMPEINLTNKEKKQVKKIFANLKSQMPDIGDKKIVALQWTGGVPTFNQDKVNDIMSQTQTRGISKESAQKIVDGLNKNGYAVLQVSLPKEEKLNNVLHLSQDTNPMHIRFLFGILNECFGLIGIDSFAQHAWAALGKKNSVVMWGATSPKQLGYDCHLNLTPTNNPCDNVHCGRPYGFVGDFLGNNEPWSCPYDDACMDYNPAFVVGKFTTLIAENESKKADITSDMELVETTTDI